MKTGRKSHGKSTTVEDLSKLSQEELIARVKQLEAHVLQLKNLLAKNSSSNEKQNKLKLQRNFDFSRYAKRHVALRVCYLGWDYQGLAVQEDTDKTIESELFKALLKTRLIECRENSNYHRSGRTDKGVSGFGQVISIDLRSNMTEGLGVILPPDGLHPAKSHEKQEEIEYVNILNKVLPPEIRVLAWAPVDPGFSSRFNCIHRTYKYIFPKGTLDIDLMNGAAQDLVGEHDFRNFCKMDVANGVIMYCRKILEVHIKPLTADSDGPYQLLELTVTGQAFLWHQIRCLAAVLFLIGEKKEDCDIVKQLLDVEANPCKPQYGMVSELPLVLFNCEYENLNWQVQDDALVAILKHLQEYWMKYTIKATMVKRMLDTLENSTLLNVCNQHENLMQGNKMRTYKKLLERPKCESLQDRIEHYAKRRKCVQKSDNDEPEVAAQQ